MRRSSKYWRVAGVAAVLVGVEAMPAATAGQRIAQYDAGATPAFGPGLGRAQRDENLGTMGPFTTYHGFRIDLAEAQGKVDVASAVKAVQNQIDIVDRAGLSPAMMDAFRAVPIRIAVSFMQGGSHYNGGAEVSLGSLQVGSSKPILLHEYMHVLEYQQFPEGARNPTMRQFFEEAQTQGLYPAESYMMSNPGEYWAMTSSCYLNGTVAREPFTRAEIRERQPDLYKFLQSVFGPRGKNAAEDARSPAAAPG